MCPFNMILIDPFSGSPVTVEPNHFTCSPVKVKNTVPTKSVILGRHKSNKSDYKSDSKRKMSDCYHFYNLIQNQTKKLCTAFFSFYTPATDCYLSLQEFSCKYSCIYNKNTLNYIIKEETFC